MKNRLPYFRLFQVIIYGKSSMRLFMGAILSFAFSISVILCTVGLMDGFLVSLKSGLKRASGDILISSSEGFFQIGNNEGALVDGLKQFNFDKFTPMIKSEGFLVSEFGSKGVIVNGVIEKEYTEVTGLKLRLRRNGVVLGKELADQLKVKQGDTVVLALAKGNKQASGLPNLVDFEVTGIVSHGIYEKDLRVIYVLKSQLSELLNVRSHANQVVAKYKNDDQEEITREYRALEKSLGFEYKVKPFWNEFSGLIKAVKVEKFSISLILQLIVIISIFNIAAFTIFITERKTRDFFVFRAMGLDSKHIASFWLRTILILWFISCTLSIGLTYFFGYLIENLSIFNLPGKIYVLSSLELQLVPLDFVIIFALSLLWVIIVSMLGIIRVSRKSVISGLRQEFS